jgi:membrane protein implicated in regulation of membrane protease activity
LPLYILLAPFLGAVLLWFTAPFIFARDLDAWDCGVSAAVVSGLLALWHKRQSRRRQEQSESLRDSALW